MNNPIRKVLNSLYNSVLLIILYGYIVLTNLKINKVFEINDRIRTSILVLVILCAILYLIRCILKSKVLILDICIFIYILYTVFLFLLNNEIDSNNLLMILYLPLMYFGARYIYNVVVKDFEVWLEITYFCILIIFACVFIYNKVTLGMQSGANTIYYQLCVLPANLRSKNKLIRIISLCMVSLCVFLSAKRTALVIWGICVVYYLILFFSMNKKKITDKIFLYICIGILLLLLLLAMEIFVSEKYGISIISRVLMTVDDGGSGRNKLIEMVYLELKDSSFFEIIFGHGMRSTAEVADGLGAHNDFIEIIYRAGIMGGIICVYIYKAIAKVIVRVKSKSYRYYSCFLCEVLIFFVLMMFSQVIFIVSYNAFFAFEIALCVAISKEEIEVKYG